MAGQPVVEDRGREAFPVTHRHMLAIAEEVAAGRTEGRILLVEHDPVYTAGRGTPPDERIPEAILIERGGKLTYHGPGQLVIYPVVRLPERDVRAWLRRLEAFGVACCADLGLQATASVAGTGVFVDGRKVGSIGVAIRRWTNLHGLAINVCMDLAPFQRIRPCGMNPSVVTDLSRCLGREVGLDEVKDAARTALFALLAERGAL